MVYFEDAWLEVGGVPIAYVPYFSAADPTVTRQSGFLAPTFYGRNHTRLRRRAPLFLQSRAQLRPDADAGLFLVAGLLRRREWRHRLDNGEYNIRVTGIDQQDPSLLSRRPLRLGRSNAGAARSRAKGEFFINDKWTFGWDVTAVSDRYYLNDYKIKDADPSRYYFQDIVSSVYLRGQADRGFFDLSAYHIESTTASTEQRTEPPVIPVLDYNRTFAIAPEMSGGIGGEVKLDLNATAIYRQEALFQSVGAQTLDSSVQSL